MCVRSVTRFSNVQALHENPFSKLYDSDQYPMVSRIDPDAPLEYSDVKSGLSAMTTLLILGVGLGLLLYAAFLELRHPRRRGKVASSDGGA
eukprot:SAG11_NODE_17109_length_528_cov_1.177156_1_plen_90_part_10